MSSDDQGIAALTPPADHHSGAGSPADYSSPQYFPSPAAESARRPSNGRSKYICSLVLCTSVPPQSIAVAACTIPANIEPHHLAALGYPIGKVMVMVCGVLHSANPFCSVYRSKSAHQTRQLTHLSTRSYACLMRSNLLRHRCHDVVHI